MRTLVPALGGTRSVPAPDPLATAYLRLALRLGQHVPGFVDAYFGPADLKAAVDIEQLRPPNRLAADARELLDHLSTADVEPDRRPWLSAQLTAIETIAAASGGERRPYLDEVEACFDLRPAPTPEAAFEAAHEALDRALPGDGTLAERIAAWDRSMTIRPERVEGTIDLLVGRFRERARASFGLPDDEALEVRLVRGQPWSAYNWYDGGGRSRVNVNTDLPIRAAELVATVAHETYPGHHLEHAWKERALIDEQGRLEHTVLLINTPECLLSEGLADVGERFVVPGEAAEIETLLAVYVAGGLDVARDAGAARDTAERQLRITRARRALKGVSGNAAMLRHVEGASPAETLAYLERWSPADPGRSAKRLEFTEHPLWRTYVFAYDEGERLLDRWLAAVAPAERPARFGRLLREPLTPSAIRADIG